MKKSYLDFLDSAVLQRNLHDQEDRVQKICKHCVVTAPVHYIIFGPQGAGQTKDRIGRIDNT